MEGPDSEAPTVRFGEFEVDLPSGELRKDGRRVRIQEKPARLLVALLEHPGRLVTRTELRERLWPTDSYGQFEDNLNSAVLRLRHALGDTASESQYIETERRRGYRFIAPVEWFSAGSMAPGSPLPAEAEGPGGPLSWLRSKPVSIGLAGLLVAFVFLAVAGRRSLHRRAIPFAERDWILIVDFRNLTGEEILDRSLQTALETGIRQSRYVNVLPDWRVTATLERMGREPSTPLTEEIAAEIALREGIRLVLVGSVARLGEVYELTARLVEPESLTDLTTVTARTDDRERLIEALDELTLKVRSSLGESMEAIRSQRVPLPRATTHSLEALKRYSEASSVMVGDRALAIRALEEAIELDPDFALAHAKLGAAFYYLNDRPRGDAHLDTALGLLDRLTTREKLWIQAEVEGWRGNTLQAIENYKLYLSEYPDSASGWFRLGYQYLTTRQCDKSEEAFRRVLLLNPSSGGSYVNLATCQALSGRYEEAIESYARAFEVAPDTRNLRALQELGTILVLADRTGEAEEVYHEMVAGDPGFQVIGYRGLAFLELLLGRFEEGVGHFRKAILLCQRYDFDTGATELRTRLFLAWALRAQGRRDELDRELEAIADFFDHRYAEPYFLSAAGKLFARERRAAALPGLLRQLSERMNEGNDRDLAAYHLLAGEIALLGEDLERASEALELATVAIREPDSLESLAHLYTLRGDLDRAISVYEEILESEAWFGYESQQPWMWAPYRLGKLYESQGDLEAAAEHYGMFVERWSEEDPDLPDLADARRRLQRLRLRRSAG